MRVDATGLKTVVSGGTCLPAQRGIASGAPFPARPQPAKAAP
jgi:hypothetical protein